MSLLTNEESEPASYVLGVPFLRATTTQLQFNTSMIAIYMDDVQDSPIVPEKPAFDFAYKYNQTIAVDSDLMYSGSIFFGDNFDGSSNVLYDSGSRLTVIPRKGARAGWFDLVESANVTLITEHTFEYTVLGQTFECELV